MLLHALDQVRDNRCLASPAHAVDQDHLLEALIDFRIFDHAHERSGPGARAQQIQPFAGLQIVQHQGSGRLAADQDVVAFADVLQSRGQGAVRHLDAEEFQVLLVVCAGDAIGPQQRPAVHVQPDHQELAILETQARIASGGKRELSVRPVMHLKNALSADGRQDSLVPFYLPLGRNVTEARANDEVFRGMA